MLGVARLVFASLIACVAAVGCVASPESADDGTTEPVSSAQQPLASSGYRRTYYSDASRTTAIGWVNWDCNPNYRESDGDTSIYWKQTRFDCPGYDDPLLPSTTCNDCITYTLSNGGTFTSCTEGACVNF